MAFYYIYVPFMGARGWALSCYNSRCDMNNDCLNRVTNQCTTCGSQQSCNTPGAACPHCAGIDGLCCAADIGGAANTAVRLRCTASIASIRTVKTGRNNDPAFDPVNNGDGLCRFPPPLPGFAWVDEGLRVELYCNYGATGQLLGTVFYGHLRNRIANGVYNDPNGLILGYLGNQDCGAPCNGCYSGIHLHMACSSNGTRNSWPYDTPLSYSQWIYRFTGPDLCPPQ